MRIETGSLARTDRASTQAELTEVIGALDRLEDFADVLEFIELSENPSMRQDSISWKDSYGDTRSELTLEPWTGIILGPRQKPN